MNILITGASGYIGRNLKERLETKYRLYIPKHKELDLLDEIAVENFFRKKNIDVVIHAAVVGGSRQEEQENKMFYESLRMFFNIVRNKKYFKKMIHLGSGAEYDKRFPIRKIKEEDFDKRVPVDDYGYYKYLCSKYIENTEGIVSLRIFGLFGKYEDYRYRFISNAICRNIFGLPITINKDVYFDYLYIEDFLKIVEYFIENDGEYKFYNIGTGKPINIAKLAKKINRIARDKSKIIIKNKGLGNEYTCDNSRLLKEIKNLSFTNIDEAIKKVYDWYTKNKKQIKK
ncbi:MAG: NAD(P)-dependent oxidoreductase [Candidatus Levybacteria bacterium]|nr:NAD(P)-dependent oxidoreductase [Candidatus Levybacteria bacterium]